jgi:hypothetical protein
VTQAHKVRMATAARVLHRLAELDGERAELQGELARIYSEMAEGETVSLRTGKRLPRTSVPQLGPISEVDRARARAALQDAAVRRRVGR